MVGFISMQSAFLVCIGESMGTLLESIGPPLVQEPIQGIRRIEGRDPGNPQDPRDPLSPDAKVKMSLPIR